MTSRYLYISRWKWGYKLIRRLKIDRGKKNNGGGGAGVGCGEGFRCDGDRGRCDLRGNAVDGSPRSRTPPTSVSLAPRRPACTISRRKYSTAPVSRSSRRPFSRSVVGRRSVRALTRVPSTRILFTADRVSFVRLLLYVYFRFPSRFTSQAVSENDDILREYSRSTAAAAAETTR